MALVPFFGRSVGVKPSSELLFAVIHTATRATGLHASSSSPTDTTSKLDFSAGGQLGMKSEGL